MFGSVHQNELPEGKSVYDYAIGEIIFAKVIGEQYLKKEGKTYYQLRMREEELEGWQRKLIEEYGKK